MRKAILTLTIGALLLMAPVVQALPKITGGGMTVNNNTQGVCLPELLNNVGFVARATGAGVLEDFAPFGTDNATVYPAIGKVKFRTTLPNPRGNLPPPANLRGKVVCIANLGPADTVDGVGNCDAGADPDTDVWEIRFQITRIQGIPLPDGGPFYGSLFVQDGGQDDWADEAFGDPTNADCLQNPFFGLERHIEGNIVVRE